MSTFFVCYYAMGWVSNAVMALYDKELHLKWFIGTFIFWPLFWFIICIGIIDKNWDSYIWKEK